MGLHVMIVIVGQMTAQGVHMADHGSEVLLVHSSMRLQQGI